MRRPLHASVTRITDLEQVPFDMHPLRRDLVVGALGRRAATLEVAGDWSSTGLDGEMHTLTGASPLEPYDGAEELRMLLDERIVRRCPR